MSAPQRWGQSSPFAAISDDWLKPVSKAGDYWFCTGTRYVGGTTGNIIEVHHASDPTGAWGSASLPTAASTSAFNYAVLYDGTQYGTIWRDYATGYPRISFGYATSPSGSWSTATAIESDATDAYTEMALAYYGGTWAITGSYNISSAFVAYSTSPTTSWTVVDDPTSGGLKEGKGIGYSNGKWVLVGHTSTDTLGIYTADTLGGTWTAASSVPSCRPGVPGASRFRVRDLNGYAVWTSNYVRTAAGTGAGQNAIFYASDPTGAWSRVSEASIGIISDSLLGETVGDIAHYRGYWLLACATDTADSAAVRYLRQASPDGAYVSVTTSALGNQVGDGIASDNTHAVLSTYYGAGVYQSDIWWLGALPTFLRQRQSPVRSPSRVSPPQLRQRQTPYIT